MAWFLVTRQRGFIRRLQAWNQRGSKDFPIDERSVGSLMEVPI